jgi:hypothetical protein
MKLKKNVTLIKEQEKIILCLNDKRCPVAEADIYLVKAIKRGISKEEKLKELIMEHDSSNETVAGFTLAKFILDYQFYLDNDDDYYEITM